MVKLLTRTRKTTGRYLGLVALTATLTACGGGSGDTVPDLDGDGTPDSEDFDADGDGSDDTALVDGVRVDKFVDLDGDGLDDISGQTEEEANAVAVAFIPVGPNALCGSEGGTDSSSATALWNDNCWVRIEDDSNAVPEGQFARSLYAVGVQRVLFCTGSGGTAGQSYSDFADGIFGRMSADAMVAFQLDSDLGSVITGDGEVGGQGWGKLQGAIEILSIGTLEPGATSPDLKDVWGFSDGPCAGIPMFYQNMVYDETTTLYTASSWLLARNVPNAAETIPFSIDPVNGL